MTTLRQLLSKNGYDRGEIANILLFSLGKLVSVFGSAMYTFAIGLYVLQLTESGLTFATTVAIGTIPMIIINPFAGVLADKVDKKKLVVIMDLANGILFIVVYFLSSIWGLKLSMIYISTFLMSIFTAIFGISIETAKPNIVTSKRLMSINSISKIIDSLSSILGPMVGGIAFILMDIKLFILFNGISFIISGISELFIDFNYSADIKVNNTNSLKFIDDIKEGFKYIGHKKWLIKLIGAFINMNFFIGLSITVPLPFIINRVLKLSSSYYGIIQGGLPIGMIIGALVVKKIRDKVDYYKLISLMSSTLALLMISIGLPVLAIGTSIHHYIYLVYYSLITIIIGFSISLVDIPLFYEIQTTIQEEYRGRVLSICMSIVKAILPIALIAAGAIINIVPAASLPIVGGVILFIITKVIFKGSL